jgi:3-oxoacyl-[acyl-carrier-protein] synthase-1
MTAFTSAGEPIMAHSVPVPVPVRGRRKHAWMAAMAIEECLAGIDRVEWNRIPLLLCVAERNRPGRLDGLETGLISQIERELGASFGPKSAVIPEGRVGAAVALLRARELIQEGHRAVLAGAVDSYLHWPTLSAYVADDRLLTSRNSNGFMPGEGAAALLIQPPTGDLRLHCTGLGFAVEPAHIDSGRPLRADGLMQAIAGALDESGRSLQELDFRVVDVSGEQYYFKEASLALARLLRTPKDRFDVWHPADCIGETGAVAGLAGIVAANIACQKRYAPGNLFLAHMSTDGGRRAACIFHYGLR